MNGKRSHGRSSRRGHAKRSVVVAICCLLSVAGCCDALSRCCGLNGAVCVVLCAGNAVVVCSSTQHTTSPSSSFHDIHRSDASCVMCFSVVSNIATSDEDSDGWCSFLTHSLLQLSSDASLMVLFVMSVVVGVALLPLLTHTQCQCLCPLHLLFPLVPFSHAPVLSDRSLQSHPHSHHSTPSPQAAAAAAVP